jgi:uncharacterized damage-inducible protein DinB
MFTNDTLVSIYKSKAWSDSQLLAALSSFNAESDPVQHKQATRIMNHIHVVDQIFKGHLSGQAHGFSMSNTEATPTLEDLSWGVHEIDAWFIDYVGKVSESELAQPIAFTFTDSDQGTMTRLEMLNHLISHGAYHRGGIGRILAMHDITPPRDLYTKFLHESEPLRRQNGL